MTEILMEEEAERGKAKRSGIRGAGQGKNPEKESKERKPRQHQGAERVRDPLETPGGLPEHSHQNPRMCSGDRARGSQEMRGAGKKEFYEFSLGKSSWRKGRGARAAASSRGEPGSETPQKPHEEHSKFTFPGRGTGTLHIPAPKQRGGGETMDFPSSQVWPGWKGRWKVLQDCKSGDLSSCQLCK